MEWIISSNTNRYRTDDALHDLGSISWYQNHNLVNVKKGDIIYIYISEPYHEIHWKCEVAASNLTVPLDNDAPYYGSETGEMVQDGPFMELKPVHEFIIPDLVSYEKLKEHGLNTRLMGPIKVVPELSTYLHSVEEQESSEEYLESYYSQMPMDRLRKIAERYSGKAKKNITTTTSYSRNKAVGDYAKRRANGFCQLCGEEAPFVDKNGNPYLETHHIKWLSKGGTDSINNTVALCPNCHRKLHILNDAKDVRRLKNTCKE